MALARHQLVKVQRDSRARRHPQSKSCVKWFMFILANRTAPSCSRSPYFFRVNFHKASPFWLLTSRRKASAVVAPSLKAARSSLWALSTRTMAALCWITSGTRSRVPRQKCCSTARRSGWVSQGWQRITMVCYFRPGQMGIGAIFLPIVSLLFYACGRLCRACISPRRG